MAVIHDSSSIGDCVIGTGTNVWQYVVIGDDVSIGKDCNICAHCFIETGVSIGNRVTLKCGVQVWSGITIEDDVFVGPNVSFCNDLFPRSKIWREPVGTVLEKGSSIGAGAVLLPGISVGANSMIGAGSVVTKSVPPNVVVCGNPARIISSINAQGREPKSYDAARVDSPLILKSKVVEDLRGSLCVTEFAESIPFNPVRSYVVFDVPNEQIRGEHAHKKCEEYLICIKGSVDVLCDDGITEWTAHLKGGDAIYLKPLIWRELKNYRNDAIVCVLSSRPYEADDYIKNYSDFVRWVHSND